MDPTAQDPSSTFPSRDQAQTRGRKATPQSKLVARESQTAHHVDDLKSPTFRKDKRAISTLEMPISRGSIANGPSRSGKVTRARATSVPSSRSQRTSPTKDRSLDVTGGQADKVSSNCVPTASQVRPNTTTNPQEFSNFESTISGNKVKDSATQINNIIHKDKNSSQCIQDLKLTKPHRDISGNKVKDSATQINNIIHRDKNSSQCIQDLKLTKPHRDRANIEKYHSDVCKEHLQKVREHPSYKRWKNDDEVRLLWIYSYNRQTIFKTTDFETGDQKRIVAVAVAKELEESPVVRNNALSYMFCQNSRDPEKLNDTAAILRGLMWLLSLTQESLTACLEETYNREGKSMYTDEHAKGALSDILLGWLKDANIDRVYLVVGAIDECYIERKDILEFLDLIIRRCKGLAKVKWLITSDCDDIYIDWIKFKLGPDDRSFETIHLNERSKTLHDPSFETLHLNKKRQPLHDPSFEALHLNKRTNMGSKARRRAKNSQRKREEAFARDTRGTDQQMKRGGAGSAQVEEGNLDKRRGSQ